MKQFALILFIVFVAVIGVLSYEKIFGIGSKLLNNYPANAAKFSLVKLHQKDADWNVIKDGAYGEFRYNHDFFLFNATKLMTSTDYTLIRFDGTLPGIVQCLARSKSDKKGSIYLNGPFLNGGPKIWLVLTRDVDCKRGMNLYSWYPYAYLFENNLIN